MLYQRIILQNERNLVVIIVIDLLTCLPIDRPLIVKLSGLTGASRTVVSGSVDAVDLNLGKLLTLILILM